MIVSSRSPLHQLLRVTEGAIPLVILPHDNPDPDALASAAALRFIVHQAYEEKEIIIALGGIVGRAENRAMLRYLNINLVPVGEIDFDSLPQVALVDTQPGRSNNSLPEGFSPTIVIDHHPAYGSYDEVPFLDLRDGYGATSTILTEYLEESHVDVESKIATALFYGINAETQDLGREATPNDVTACQFLYPYTNKRRLAKIENARVPREYFKVFRDALEEAVLYDKVVISMLYEVQYPDMVAEVADFLLRLDESEWAMAIGVYRDNMHVSLRTTNRDANAGEILQKVLGSKSAGGHDMIAGGRIKVSERGVAAEKAAVRIKDRLLKALGVDASSAEDLVR
ncbi:MAG: DHH family phosphoesterase [Deltaproteobacteria bacterium]|nr:DHH family phosphoesterase [Deltaproteobacteria bacterium]